MARPRESALSRARRRLTEGRPDLARDTLTGYLLTLHQRAQYDPEAYALLGEAYFAMREYARAGAVWLLTERTGADVDAALQAFERRYGKDSANILRVVKPRAPSELYPPGVQERLKRWNYRFQRYRPRSNPHILDELQAAERPTGLRPVEVGCLLAGLAFLLAGAFWVWNYFLR